MRGTEESEVELMIPRIVGGNKNVTLIDLLEAGGASTEIDDQQRLVNNTKPTRSMKMVPFRITKWHAVFGFRVLLCVWLLLLTFRSSPPPTVVFQDSPRSMISLAKLHDGRTSLDVDADLIRIVKPVVHQLDGVIRNGVRAWSSPILRIYVGDYISWTWASNENVVECSDTGLLKAKIDRYIDSGDLKSDGTYERQFDMTNTYYFCSENSQTLTGKVTVIPRSVIVVTLDKKMGPVPTVPAGVMTNLTSSELDIMDGCWKSCYNTNTEMNKEFNYDTVVAECTGDYIFIGVAASAAPDKYIIGAFGRKAVVFSKAQQSNGEVVHGMSENGVNWFRIYDETFRSHNNIGFLSLSGGALSVNRNYQVPCHVSPECDKCVSMNYDLGSFIGCTKVADNSALYKRVFMTNTCPLTVLPGGVV